MDKVAEEQKQTILAVDDQALSLFSMKSLLGPMYNLIPAKDCETAWDVLHTVKADLILLDIEMPNVTGLEFIDMLRTTPALADIPVIFVTSHGTEETIRKAMTSGAKDFIVKPVKSEKLLRKVFALLGPPPEYQSRP